MSSDPFSVRTFRLALYRTPWCDQLAKERLALLKQLATGREALGPLAAALRPVPPVLVEDDASDDEPEQLRLKLRL